MSEQLGYALVKDTPGWVKGRVRLIPLSKLIINRDTPVGDDPDYYEAMPHGGKKCCYLVAKLCLDEHYKLVWWADQYGRQCNMGSEESR